MSVVVFVLSFTLLLTCPGDTKCSHDLKYHVRYSNEICYQFVPLEKYWSEAGSHCRNHGGQLLKIDNQDTNEFIINELNDLWHWKNDGVWIGLNDRNNDNHWMWTTKKLDYEEELGQWTNWGSGHPQGALSNIRNCVRMKRENGKWKWHETFCHALLWKYRFICQYQSDGNSVTKNETYRMTSYSINNEAHNELLIHNALPLTSSNDEVASGNKCSKMIPLFMISFAALLIILLFAIIFKCREKLRQQNDTTQSLKVLFKSHNAEDKSIKMNCRCFKENVYIDEQTQMMIKFHENISQIECKPDANKMNIIDNQLSNIYEELPDVIHKE